MSGIQNLGQGAYANYEHGLSQPSDGVIHPDHGQSIQSPSVLPWIYIPLPKWEETTERFAFRALDACLESYLEWAAHGMENGRALSHAEILHLVNHVKASSRFREPREVIWGPQTSDAQLDFKERSEMGRKFVECRESISHDVRQFHLYAQERRSDYGVAIDGPFEHGDVASELHIVVKRPPAKTILVSIGYWTGRRVR